MISNSHEPGRLGRGGSAKEGEELEYDNLVVTSNDRRWTPGGYQ